MSVIYQTVMNTGKLYFYRKSFNSYLYPCKCLLSRKYSDSVKKFQTFDEVVARRRAEARRSLVVQVNSDSSFNELYSYCTKYANIEGMHHYNNSDDEHFMLIEFASEDNLKDILQTCGSHQRLMDVMALQSPFLWFKAMPGKKEASGIPDSMTLTTGIGEGTCNEDVLFENLSKCSSVSEQVQLLYDSTVLNDVAIRLRYMVARQLEVIFASLYSNIAVRPFGSSVNGFGRLGCDLDLVLTNDLTEEMSDPRKRLIYQEKKCEGGRSPWQRHMELVAELLELRVPGAARVTRILNARVPIVKYCHKFANVECDLCYNNISGVYMSELLWLFGSLDPRVRPLTFVIRRWAKNAGLTNQHPGRWITNFPLTLMVLFFLQSKNILPSLKLLVQNAGKEDIRLGEDSLNCTFLRDMSKLPTDKYGQDSADLETLLLQFFEYYAQFDFQDKAISIFESVPVRKPSGLPLYIVNPLEKALNVSRNVSFEECERLRLEVRNAAWQLESVTEGEKTDAWGILSLIEKKSTQALRKLLRVGSTHRLVSVKDLFMDEDVPDEGNKNSYKNKIDRLSKNIIDKSVKDESSKTNAKEIIKFKNEEVARAVRRVRREKMLDSLFSKSKN